MPNIKSAQLLLPRAPIPKIHIHTVGAPWATAVKMNATIANMLAIPR